MSVLNIRRLVTVGLCGAALAIPATARAQYPLDELHQFIGSPGPAGPEAPLIAGRDGALYGTTYNGGAFNRGTIFRMTLAGATTTLYSFTGGAGGEHPTAALLEADDGSFYGMAEAPVAGQEATAVFRLSPAGQFAIVHRFPFVSGVALLIEASPLAPLIQAADGNIYGATRAAAGSFAAGDFTAGKLFRMTPSGDVTVLHDFAVHGGVEQGLFPTGLIQAADGSFYGTTTYGGAGGQCFDYQCGYGTVFRMSPTGAVTLLHAFTDGTGLPFAPLIQTSDGNFYGTTGQGKGGTVFRIAPSGAFSSLYAFPFVYDDRPAHPPSLTRAADGNLYGTYAPEAGGALFRLSLQGVVTWLHTFGLSSNGRPSPDGNQPLGLVQGSDGRLYGTTDAGGLGAGTAFVMDSAGTTTTLHRFTFGADGLFPTGLIQASDANFYGVTESGGIYGRGTVFRLTPSGSYSVIYSFTGGRDGARPVNVVQGRDGRLYGTAAEADISPGVIFRVTLDGNFTVLHTFDWTRDGGNPKDLVVGSDGNLYGTTDGGAFERGTVFRATPGGAVTVVHSFTGRGTDGGFPRPRLISASDGHLYGTAFRDTGAYAFRITPSGAFTALLDLSVPGFAPTLMAEADGNLYGAPGCGIGGRFFRMPLSGSSLTLLAATDVICPVDGFPGSFNLTRGTDGAFYGTLAGGGSGGRVFQMTTGGTLTLLHDFGTERDYPRPTGVIHATDGNLYGTTSFGGPRPRLGGLGPGTIFRVRIRAPLSPASLTATPAGIHGITLRWTGAAGATSYVVRRLVPGQPPALIARGLTATTLFVRLDASPSNAVYVVSAVNDAGESLFSMPMHLALVSRTPTIATVGDYDGDGKADLTVYRSSNAGWFTLQSGDNRLANVQWGAPALLDRPVPADYDGDGKVDVAVYRETTGEWFIYRSSDGRLTQLAWGAPALDDVAIPADYDGDGSADIAVFRGTTGEWYVYRSSNGTLLHLSWGAPTLGDLPVPADYDGDGRADIAVYRSTTGEWFVYQSSNGALLHVGWGSPALNDVPVPADYDGDGRTDLAVYRGNTGEWFISRSSDGALTRFGWGAPAFDDLPIAADYDGDGHADLAVYRLSTGEWFIIRDGLPRQVPWGAPLLGDSVRRY